MYYCLCFRVACVSEITGEQIHLGGPDAPRLEFASLDALLKFVGCLCVGSAGDAVAQYAGEVQREGALAGEVIAHRERAWRKNRRLPDGRAGSVPAKGVGKQRQGRRVGWPWADSRLPGGGASSAP
jgi:hypothetical protein